MRKGLLHRKVNLCQSDECTFHFVLPSKYKDQAGLERCLDLLKDRFYWSTMANDIENHVRQCGRHLHFKQILQKPELNPVEITHPMKLVHIDYLTVESGVSKKDFNILIVRDHFIKYSQAFIIISQPAKVTTQTLLGKYFVYYCFPDQG